MIKLYFSSIYYLENKNFRANIPSSLEFYNEDKNFNNLINHLMNFYIIEGNTEIFFPDWRIICLYVESTSVKHIEIFALNDPFIQKSYLEAKKLAMLL